MPKTTFYKLSVLIVNYKSWDKLSKCLDALSIAVDRRSVAEIVVVDNHSGDGRFDEFTRRYTDVTFVASDSNLGFAAACNLAARRSSGDYMLFLNPDTEISSESIQNLMEAYQEGGWAILSGRERDTKGRFKRAFKPFPQLGTLFGLFRLFNRWGGKGHEPSAQDNWGCVPSDWVSGSLVLISRDWLRGLNGWSEDYFMYYEDVDLCQRVHGLGGSVGACLKAPYDHFHGASSRHNLKTRVFTKSEVMISRHIYVNKYFKGLERWVADFLLVADVLLIMAFPALLGILFFYVPKLRANTLIWWRMVRTYSIMVGVMLSGKSPAGQSRWRSASRKLPVSNAGA